MKRKCASKLEVQSSACIHLIQTVSCAFQTYSIINFFLHDSSITEERSIEIFHYDSQFIRFVLYICLTYVEGVLTRAFSFIIICLPVLLN